MTTILRREPLVALAVSTILMVPPSANAATIEVDARGEVSDLLASSLDDSDYDPRFPDNDLVAIGDPFRFTARFNEREVDEAVVSDNFGAESASYLNVPVMYSGQVGSYDFAGSIATPRVRGPRFDGFVFRDGIDILVLSEQDPSISTSGTLGGLSLSSVLVLVENFDAPALPDGLNLSLANWEAGIGDPESTFRGSLSWTDASPSTVIITARLTLSELSVREVPAPAAVWMLLSASVMLGVGFRRRCAPESSVYRLRD